MKRLLTAGIFGTILGIVGASTANASIVSSGFLDEKLTEYALSTSLDLKANQSDFTELNTQISDSIDYLKTLWAGAIGELAYDFNPNKVNNNNIDGAFSLVGGILSHSMLSLTEGWTDSNDGTTYLGVKYLNTKIGTLPSGDLPGFPGAEFLFPWLKQSLTYPTSLAELITAIYGNSETDTQGLLGSIIAGFQYDFDQDARPQYIGLIPNYELAKTANNKIGKLPSGAIPTSKGLGVLLPGPAMTTYPTSIGNFMTDIYTGYWSTSAIADAVYFGNEYTGQKDPTLVVKGLRQITDDIGTLPSGDFPWFAADTFLFSALNQPLTYPTSLAELITAIYGNLETGTPGLLTAITTGFQYDFDRDGRPDDSIGLKPNYHLAKNANDLAEANAAKIGTVPDGKNLAGMIGTLPAGYDSVGAALTAIKGIAEDAKAAALAAIPDPKQEGSSGKYVLTVDIVGDNATYRWEKIDRESEPTTTE